MINKFYRHRSAVAVFPSLLEAVAAHRGLEQVFGLRLIQETLRVPRVQELLIVDHAAVAEELWDVVATVHKKVQAQASTCHLITLIM